MPGFILEFPSAVKSRQAGDDDVTQRNILTDAPTSASANNNFRLNGFDKLIHELSQRNCRPIAIKMQARFEQQNFCLADRARKIQPETVIIARHEAVSAVEWSLVSCNQRDIIIYIMPILIPTRNRIARCEQCCQCFRLLGGVGDDNCVVSFEFWKVIGFRRSSCHRAWSRHAVSRPGNGAGKIITGLGCFFGFGLYRPCEKHRCSNSHDNNACNSYQRFDQCICTLELMVLANVFVDTNPFPHNHNYSVWCS